MRKNGTLPWLRPDAKSQVTVRYQDGRPALIDTVVLSTQHDEGIGHDALSAAIIEHVIRPVLPADMLSADTRFLTQPDRPLRHRRAGRRLRPDRAQNYCRYLRRLGTPRRRRLSGKDPSKVDRSAAYALRHVAKNVVAAGLADKCEVQVAYAIGIAQPVSVMVTTFGTGRIADEKIEALINRHFDLRPKAIVQQLDLLRPIYRPTAAYGHFGRTEPEFAWEHTDKADLLKADAGI